MTDTARQPVASSAADPAGLDATVEVVPFGDAALLVTFGDRADPRLTARAQAAARAIEAVRSAIPAIGRPVPAHASVLVPFDPLVLDLGEAIERVAAAVAASGSDPRSDVVDDAARGGQSIEIPVRYGGPDGPDLDEVADLHDLRPADVVELHAGATYRVLFLGFAPGFAYLGGLPIELVTPRRPTPRERVPAGSVGIAGEQTGIYPLAMPGGWRLIGRSDAVLFDPTQPDPARLHPGAIVRFVPVR